MRPLTRTALLAAAALAAGAPAPALAQTYGWPSGQGYDRQDYPPSTYDRNAPSGYPPPSDRGSSGGYQTPPANRGGYPPSAYEGADRYGAPDSDNGGQPPAQDPQELSRRLNLTASQQGAYDSYRRAFQPDDARMRQEEDDMRRMASLPTPQRLDMARASMARDRADFDRTDAATRAFYAQLSPAQRRTFDQLTAPQMDDGDGEGGPSPMQPAARPPR